MRFARSLDARAARGWPDARAVARGRDGQRIEYVGIVVCRQQFARFARVLKTTSLLGVTGKLQVQEGIVHLIAEAVWRPQLSRPVTDLTAATFTEAYPTRTVPAPGGALRGARRQAGVRSAARLRGGPLAPR